MLGEGLRALVVMLVLNATLFLFFGLLSYFFGDSWNSGSPFEPIARSPNRAERLGFIVLACAVAPVAEEVFFRGMLYSFLRQRLHLIVAVLIQAVVFALMHPFDLAQRAVVFILGVGLGLTYEWRKTLLTSILLHALLNAFWMAILAWGIAADADAPRLGVFGESRDGGCLITEVVPGSAAQSAGLQVGDLVTAVDGRPVADWSRFTRMIRSKKVGDQVSIEFMRNGTANRVEAVLVKLRE